MLETLLAPVEVWRMMDKCWSMDPEQRPTMKELRETLGRTCGADATEPDETLTVKVKVEPG
jgi:hypothetical protein